MSKALELQNAYLDGLKIKKSLDDGILDGKVKRNAVNTLFTNHTVWKHHRTHSGHAHVECQLTKIHIGYQLHNTGGKKSNVLNTGHTKDIKEQLEEHLNKLAEILKINVDDFSKTKEQEVSASIVKNQHSLFSTEKTHQKSHDRFHTHKNKR